MTDKRIAFMMPVYPPHYDYARNFLRSFKKHKLDKQADIWFVFSNNEDLAMFPDGENAIVIPPNIKLDIVQVGRLRTGVINIKKFYGLSMIKDKYEYVLMVDAETLIIKNIDLHKLCADFFDRQILWGNIPTNQIAKKIIESCRRHFDISEKFDNEDLYLWFNNPCIYRTSHLNDFFFTTAILEKFEDLSSLDFDYYVYMLYLVFYHGFRIENIYPKYCGFAEACTLLVRPEYIKESMCMATPIMWQQIKKLGGGGGGYVFVCEFLPFQQQKKHL
jgi:hypothetical protein